MARLNALARLTLLAFLTILFLPAAAPAQKLYKCQKDGKVVFSNTPCTGAAGSVQSSSPLKSKVTTLAGPAPGRVYSADDKELLARIQKDLPDLTARCEAGDQQVCALLDCVLKADRLACARAEGRMEGVGWRERSRRENKLRRNDPKLGSVAETELELTIECVPGPAVHSVYWGEQGRAYLRDGEPVVDASTGKKLRAPGSQFATIGEAAEAVCGGKAANKKQ